MPGYWWKNLKETVRFDGLGIDGKILLTIGTKETGWESLAWFPLTHKRQKWLAVLNSVMNIRLP